MWNNSCLYVTKNNMSTTSPCPRYDCAWVLPFYKKWTTAVFNGKHYNFRFILNQKTSSFNTCTLTNSFWFYTLSKGFVYYYLVNNIFFQYNVYVFIIKYVSYSRVHIPLLYVNTKMNTLHKWFSPLSQHISASSFRFAKIAQSKMSDMFVSFRFPSLVCVFSLVVYSLLYSTKWIVINTLCEHIKLKLWKQSQFISNNYADYCKTCTALHSKFTV